MSHVAVQFIVAEETFVAELAEWVYTTLNLVFRHTFLLSSVSGGKMSGILGECVQCMFVWKDFLVGNTQVAELLIRIIVDKRRQIGTHHMNLL